MVEPGTGTLKRYQLGSAWLTAKSVMVMSPGTRGEMSSASLRILFSSTMRTVAISEVFSPSEAR